MEIARRVQIHQSNDPEILEFFNAHRLEYRVIGDHLFIIRGRGGDVPVGPGDWLAVAADGEVEVRRGDYARRAQRELQRTRKARRVRDLEYRATVTTHG
jgi:hypothetical protein